MFGFLNRSRSSSKSSSNGPIERVVAQFPQSAVPDPLFTSDQLANYMEQARVLGFGPMELLKVQLIDFFITSSIAIYDFEETRLWLEEGPVRQKQWWWRPLRAADIPSGAFNRIYYRTFSATVWDKLIPAEVLEKVLTIHTKFGKDLMFFVSSASARDDRHFLMVMPAEGLGQFDESNCFIFACW